MCTGQDVTPDFPEFGWDNNRKGSLDLPCLLTNEVNQVLVPSCYLTVQCFVFWKSSQWNWMQPFRHTVHLFLSFLSFLIFTSQSFSKGILDSFGDRLPMQGRNLGWRDNKMRADRWWGHLPAKRQKLTCRFASSQSSLPLMNPANMEINRRLQTAVGIKR